MKRTLLLLVALLVVIPVMVSAEDATNWSYTTPGSYTWNSLNLTEVTVLMSGAGGGGSAGISPQYCGKGGSAGASQLLIRQTVTPNTNYSVVVGTKGAKVYWDNVSNAGSSTVVFGYNKAGGAGGIIGCTGGYGGDGGAGVWNLTRFAENGTALGLFKYPGVGGIGYGAGGGGGSTGGGVTNQSGGAGADGAVLIYEYGTYDGANIPDFTASPTTTTPGSLVSFTDASIITNSTALTYQWDFGDGTTSNTTGNVKHVYAYLGSYDVSLNLTNDAGNTITETKEAYINIVTTPTVYANPRTVSLICTDFWNNPIPSLTVNVTPLNFTAPDDWLVKYYGFGSGVTLTSTGFSGITGGDGSWAAPMSESIRYQFDFSGGGITPYSETFYPSSESYFIRIPTGSVYVVPTPASNYITYTLANVTLNTTYEFFNLTYRDTSGGTPNLTLTVKNANGTVLYTGTSSAFGTNVTTLSSGALKHAVGDMYTYSLTAPQNQIGNVTVVESIFWQATNAVGLTGFPTWTGNWVGIGLLVLLSATFSFISKRFAMVVIPLMAILMMIYMRWITPSVGSVAMLASLVVLLVIGVLMYIREGAIREGMA